jgi:hypothetical protein
MTALRRRSLTAQRLQDEWLEKHGLSWLDVARDAKLEKKMERWTEEKMK